MKKKQLRYDYDRLLDIWEKHKITDYFANRFIKEIESEFNWGNMIKEMKSNPDCLRSDEDCDEYYAIYVDTVFNLAPSGKYYTPWARSNVTDKEGLIDEIWYEALQSVLCDKDLWAESGEGDPCDIFFCMLKDS